WGSITRNTVEVAAGSRINYALRPVFGADPEQDCRFQCSGLAGGWHMTRRSDVIEIWKPVHHLGQAGSLTAEAHPGHCVAGEIGVRERVKRLRLAWHDHCECS